MSKISKKLNIINNAKKDIKTAIENKGVSVGDIGIQDYAGKIDEMKVATPITKGLIINAYDEYGYPTDVELVGISDIPNYYLYQYDSYSFFAKVVNLKLSNEVTSIGNYAFNRWSSLKSIVLPSKVNSIGMSAFTYNSNLQEVYCEGNITSINSNAFKYCSQLTKFIMPNITSVPTLQNSTIFDNTPIKSGTGYVYVPDTLVTQIQSASNWSTIASQIKGVSEL